jgi:NADH:ubiquinone oxidoreductase subunit 6 (subunit J)
LQPYYLALQTWASTGIESGFFYLLAFLSIPLAYGVLFDPRIIRCGFLLIGVFGAISGLFFLLQAQFLALAQLMIYAVGITLVVVIALMLTNPRMETDNTQALPEQKLPAAIISVLLFITIYLGLRSETWVSHVSKSSTLQPQENILQLGTWLLGYYSMPFEFASVLLLIALVGAIMLAKADTAGGHPEQWSEESLEANEDNVVKV